MIHSQELGQVCGRVFLYVVVVRVKRFRSFPLGPQTKERWEKPKRMGLLSLVRP